MTEDPYRVAPPHPAAPGYGTPYVRPGYPPEPGAPGAPGAPEPPGDEERRLRNGAAAALIANLLALVLCLGLMSLPGAVCAVVALNRSRTEMRSARRWLTWSWWLLAANVLLYVLIAALIVGLALAVGYSGAT